MATRSVDFYINPLTTRPMRPSVFLSQRGSIGAESSFSPNFVSKRMLSHNPQTSVLLSLISCPNSIMSLSVMAVPTSCRVSEPLAMFCGELFANDGDLFQCLIAIRASSAALIARAWKILMHVVPPVAVEEPRLAWFHTCAPALLVDLFGVFGSRGLNSWTALCRFAALSKRFVRDLTDRRRDGGNFDLQTSQCLQHVMHLALGCRAFIAGTFDLNQPNGAVLHRQQIRPSITEHVPAVGLERSDHRQLIRVCSHALNHSDNQVEEQAEIAGR
jgi:hypothetical protein